MPSGPAARVAGALLLTLALTLVGLPSAAHAAPTWLAATPVSDPADPVEDTFTIGQRVAFDSQGNALAVWPRSVGPSQTIQASFRPAGGSFTPAQNISAAAQQCLPCGLEVDVAFDPQGNAVAVWNQDVDGEQRIQAAFRPVGGSFGAPVNISAAGGDACCPTLAVAPGGGMFAAWNRFDGSNLRVQVAFRPPGGAFGPAETASPAGQQGAGASIAVSPSGNVMAVWILRNEGAMTERTQAAFRPAGGSFGGAQNLTDPAPACDCPVPTDVAFDPNGRAVAVWPRFDGTTLNPPDGNYRVQVADQLSPDSGAVFGPGQSISAAGQDAGQDAGLDLEVDSGRNALVVWRRSDGTNGRVQAAFRPAGGSFGSGGVNISPAGQDACCAEAAFGPQGDAIAVWEQTLSGTNQRIYAANRPPGSACSAADGCGFAADQHDLSGAGEDSAGARLAVDAQGNAISAWSSGDIQGGSFQRVHAAAGYDAVGPQLRSLQFPSSPAGVPLSFSVSPLDVWSPVVSTIWSFGDGGTASGAKVTHAYASPGRYRASVTSTDAVGNSSRAERTVVIRDETAPSFTRLRIRPRRFSAARRGSSIAKVGTRVSYRLSEAARVRFAVQRAARGRRVGGRCRRETARNRTRRRCTRYVSLKGRFSHRGKRGANRFRFTGRLRRRALRRGRYRLSARATDSAGNRSATRRARFRIVRRAPRR